MAVITFGNGIKVNFDGNPTESDVEEVAQKLIKDGVIKNDTLNTTPTNTLERVGGILDVAFGGKRIGEAVGTQVAKMIVPPEQKQLVSGGPTPLQVAGDVAVSGLTVAGLRGVGTIGKFSARLLKTLGLGAGISGGRALAEGTAPTQAIKPAIIGGAISGAIPFAGAGLRAVGRQVELLPSRFISSALSRSKAEVLQDIAQDNVDNLSKYVLKSKAVLKSANTHLKESNFAIEKVSNQITNKLAGAKTTIGVNNFFDDIANIPEAQGALLKRKDIRNIVTRLAPQTKQLVSQNSWTLEEANRLRQLVDKTLGDRAFLGAQLSSDKIILKRFANSLRETVKTKAPQGVRELFQELSYEIRFRDGLLERIAKKQGNQVLSFGDFIGGGLGGIFGGGLGGAALGVATRRVIESVPFKLSAAKVVNAATKIEPIINQLTPAQQTAILNLIGEIVSPASQSPKQ